MKNIWIGAFVCVASAGPGCSGKDDGQGSAQVSVQALSLAGDVKAMDVAVAGPGIPVPVSMPLFKQADGNWKALVGHIPAGSDRTFSARAYDDSAKAHQIYSGVVGGVTIHKDQTADVTIVLQEDQASPNFANHAPVVDGLVVSSTGVSHGDRVAVTLTAHDQDPGETGTLSFDPTVNPIAGCGSFGAPSLFTDGGGNSVWTTLWTAPEYDNNCQLIISVTDVHGARAMAAATITVSAGQDTGGARVSTLVESYPIITNITSTATPPATFLVAGGSTTLQVIATQPDLEPMSFAWSSDCAGAFGTPSAPSSVFTLAAGSTASTCTFAVVVSSPSKTGSDGQSKSLNTTGKLTVRVGVSSAESVGGPVIDFASQSLGAVEGGGVITLYVKAHEDNSNASLLSYAWNASGGTLGSPVQAADLSLSQVAWIAPTVMVGSESISVTITDSQGAATSVTFTVLSGCACRGNGPGGPVTVDCGQSACGQDFMMYSCSATGWSPTGASCGRDGGLADSGVCECIGTGPGNGPVTAPCGQEACGSDSLIYACSATGWSGTGVSCGIDGSASDSIDGGVADSGVCECVGTGRDNHPVTASCGQSACGSDLLMYACTASGWSGPGQSCSSLDAAACQCNGQGPGGVPVTVSCGQSSCGSDLFMYACSASGWTGPGQSCTGP